MKIYSFFSVLLVSLLLFSCTQSNEEKAMALIETDMNQTLLHPSSFEVAKMELDSCFKDDKTHNAEIFRLGYDIATLYNKYKKVQENVKRAESSMSMYADTYRMGYDFGVQQYKQYKKERDQAMAKAESYKEEIMQLYKNNIEIGVWVKLRGFLSMLCLYRSNCVVNFVLFNLAFCGLLYNFAPQSEA